MDRYEAQLHSRASSKALEVARVMIRDKIGFEAQIADRGPPRRRKKDRGSLGTPEAPPLCPAALEPAWSKGKLILLSKPAESDSDSVVLATALKLLRAEIASLAEDADRDDTINQRSIACLRSVAARIPGYVPAQDELFYLAHVKEFLEPMQRSFMTNGQPCLRSVLTRCPSFRSYGSAVSEMAGLRPQCGKRPADVERSRRSSRTCEYDNCGTARRRGAKSCRPSDPLGARIFPCAITKRHAEAALEFKYFGPPNGKTNFANDAVSSVEKDSGQGYIWMIRTLLGIITSAPTLALRSKCCWLKSIVCDLRA
jgi:hypothetical protein